MSFGRSVSSRSVRSARVSGPHPALTTIVAQAPELLTYQVRPGILWVTDRHQRLLSQDGPLARVTPRGVDGTVAEWATAHASAGAEATIRAHDVAHATQTPQRYTVSVGDKHYQCLVRPLIDANEVGERRVIGLVGTACLIPPAPCELRALLGAMADGTPGRRLAVVALADLAEHGLTEGDELVLVPGSAEERARMRSLPAAVLLQLLQDGLLVPTTPLPAAAAATPRGPPAPLGLTPLMPLRGPHTAAAAPSGRRGLLRLLPRSG